MAVSSCFEWAIRAQRALWFTGLTMPNWSADDLIQCLQVKPARGLRRRHPVRYCAVVRECNTRTDMSDHLQVGIPPWDYRHHRYPCTAPLGLHDMLVSILPHRYLVIVEVRLSTDFLIHAGYSGGFPRYSGYPQTPVQSYPSRVRPGYLQ